MKNVHDHFDGSFHCVECRGPCTLKGPELWLTELIRWRFESIARGYGRALDPMEIQTLGKAGVNIDRFAERASQSQPRRTREAR